MRHLPCDEHANATRWLLPGDPFRVDKIKAHLTDAYELGWAREYRMVQGLYNGHRVGICSTGIGGPSTAIAVHELHELGATHLVRVGTCGALKPHIKVGHTVVADLAYGVKYPISRVYPSDGRWQAKPSLTDFAADWVGPLFSSDWFYNDVIDTPPADAVAVEMEAVTLFYLAELFDIQAGAVCACSDSKTETDYEAGIDRAIISALDGIVQ